MKRLAALTAAFAAAAAIIPFASPAEKAAADTDSIKIMCIGDSITDGYVPEYTGSYRKFIYHGLTEKGYSIDMVGAKDGGYTPSYTDPATGESFQFDNENTGYSGYAIKAYPGRSGILETLKQTDCLRSSQPDIVTLQIGTNNIIDNHDMGENKKDLEELIVYILDNIPDDSVLFVSTIPAADPNREGVRDWFMNYRHSADWQTQYNDSEVELSVHKAVSDYNVCIEDLWFSMKDEHKNFFVSYAGNRITDENKAELLFDGVHPNNDGYREIGSFWTDVINEYLSGGPGNVTTTAATSTTATTTTTSVPGPVSFTVSDLVRFSRYLLGDKSAADDFHEQIKTYDIDSDGVLDTFDLVLMRKLLIEKAGALGG